jgi:hypothetical protein
LRRGGREDADLIMSTGKVIVNDEHQLKVALANGEVVMHLKDEYQRSLLRIFPVGQEVQAGDELFFVFDRNCNGHIYLPVHHKGRPQ